MKLLLAEDTKDMNRVITAALEHEGYDVDSVYDGEAALEQIRGSGYDGVILDIMMPKRDGLSVLRKLRAENIMVPVLLLTAKAEVDDRVAGLDAGADDYLTKPFAIRELLARVRAMTRRHTDYAAMTLRFGDIRLDDKTFELSCTNSVRLCVREFELLQSLILNAGHEVSTGYLLEHVWEGSAAAGPDTVWLYVSYLRGKLRAVNSRVSIEGEKGGTFRLLEADEGEDSRADGRSSRMVQMNAAAEGAGGEEIRAADGGTRMAHTMAASDTAGDGDACMAESRRQPRG